MSLREISFANRHPRLRLDRRAVAQVIHLLDDHAEKFRCIPPPGELSLVFLTDPALAKLHDEFLGDPTTTDVITFEGDRTLHTAGEICVSVDAALRHVTKFVVPPSGGIRQTPAKAGTTNAGRAVTGEFSRELTLYIVHGWLHLAGYDDLAPAKKRAMRRAEARAMALLRTARTLASFSFRP